MPRGKKADANGAPAPKGAAPATGSNELTDDQRQALFFNHKRAYEASLAKKKEADAAFKNVCKLAKAELGDDAVKSIKDAILLDSPEGEAQLQAEIVRVMRIARWMNIPFGAQPDMFSDFSDPRPATERARAEGKKSGMEGLVCKPPYAPTLPQADEWTEGWREGQRAIFSIQKTADGDVFDASDEERRQVAAQAPDFVAADTAH